MITAPPSSPFLYGVHFPTQILDCISDNRKPKAGPVLASGASWKPDIGLPYTLDARAVIAELLGSNDPVKSTSKP